MAAKIPAIPIYDQLIVGLEGRCDVDWYRCLKELETAIRDRVARTGQVTLSGTSAVVAFDTPEPDDSYNVVIEAPENRSVWISGKTVAGFTLNVSAFSVATYGWTVIRR